MYHSTDRFKGSTHSNYGKSYVRATIQQHQGEISGHLMKEDDQNIDSFHLTNYVRVFLPISNRPTLLFTFF